MMTRQLRQWPLAAAIAAAVACAGFCAGPLHAGPVRVIGDGPAAGPGTRSGLDIGPGRYIVRFVEEPVAEYNQSVARGHGVAGIGAIPTKAAANGRRRLDVASAQATAYAGYLAQRQAEHLQALGLALGRPLAPSSHVPHPQMRHALDAVVVEMSAAEARLAAQVDGVAAVYRDAAHAPATDIGPGFIGAASIWWGLPATQDTLFASGFESVHGFRGDGIVVGDIDTGYNSMSPSFAAVDDGGYAIQNPLGHGNYLGQCGVAGISLAGCNDKVIGAYDMVDATAPFSVEDTQSHGSHTASTIAGDGRTAELGGFQARISGVAPHANLVIFYACSPDPNVLCQDSATSGAVDLAIQDGVIDALNFSISGGTRPWADPTSLAFLSAADAGIFVAAAAGNTSTSVPQPLPGTANHREPWVTTVAAGTHTGGAIGSSLSVTGPGTPPANLAQVPLTEATGDTPLTAALPATTPLVLSPQFHNADTNGSDGCSGYPAGAFAAAIALVSRGSCNFTVKVANARAAGAIAVVISDNRVEGPFTPDLTSDPQPIPVWSVLQGDGTQLQTFLAAHAGAGTAAIGYPPARLPAQPDVLAGFSLIGPADFDVVKPDVQAPGVAILAAYANDGSAGGPDLVGLMDGTSMATPHTTGSGALLLGLHPEWTPAEIKSALMMTAKESGLTKPDGTTPSDAFDRGSGRLQDFAAAAAGLVLDESGLNFMQADPAAGGDPAALNLASLQDLGCVNQCTFTRKLRSTQDHAVTWTAGVGGDTGVGVAVAPASFPVGAAPASAEITVTVDTSALPADGSVHFAEVVLTPSDAALPPLHLPVAVAMPAPRIAASPSPVSIALGGHPTGSGTLTVANAGGPTLTFSVTASGSGVLVPLDQPSADAYGFTSVKYTGLGAGDTDYYAADDFVLTGNDPIDLGSIVAPGFTQSSTLASFGASLPLHWRIYGDAGGVPAGNPDAAAPPAAWHFDATAGSPGVSVAGDAISLDLAAAGLHTALPAGHYWIVVYPELPCADSGGGCTNQWYWLTSAKGSGGAPVSIAPPSVTPAWTPIPASNGAGFALHVQMQAPCAAAPWLAVSPGGGSLAGGATAPLTLTATAAQFAGNAATSYLCLQSNDASTPLLPVQVDATR